MKTQSSQVKPLFQLSALTWSTSLKKKKGTGHHDDLTKTLMNDELISSTRKNTADEKNKHFYQLINDSTDVHYDLSEIFQLYKKKLQHVL